ncbi:hypothetical protein CSE16_01570 [Solibacillus sp. R5-41]|uniref:DUF1850 domain-containing protein n=1 Tax=Solibacillus sp. R5-41 TaxID=2048654 RepID=UPI000C127481|nr:DUF1850 domain-containing protein [Solibacillus sp. R5-41]ATP38806.1 hypothetical protein CSE16_01570 [Solibacillus sp. R5-41]
MKKWFVVSVFFICCAAVFIPFQRALVFTETRNEEPTVNYVLLNSGNDFQIVFTHSIHLSDVIESYRVLTSNEFQLVSMKYSDVAIGMPGHAEEGQALIYENGVYTLRYDDAKLPNFTLHIGAVQQKLILQYGDEEYNLKKNLVKGKSYFTEVRKISFYEKMKGVKLNDKKE